jgi:hypothetical protein
LPAKVNGHSINQKILDRQRWGALHLQNVSVRQRATTYQHQSLPLRVWPSWRCSTGTIFDSWDGEALSTPNQVLGIVFEELKDYLMIGSNSSGDPICIDLEINNEVVYLNHDNYFERIFMNSSISQLLQSIIKYESFWASLNPRFENNVFFKRKFSDEEFNQLKQDFLMIDNRCLDDNSCWLEELQVLLWERDNE